MKSPPVHASLSRFAEEVTKMTALLTRGEPEEQLRAPFETFLSEVGDAWGWQVACAGEAPLPDRLGRPDFAVHRGGLLTGYVELKAPGIGANAQRFTGRNKDQFKRYSNLPNVLYTDGNEWALYRDGRRTRNLVRLQGDCARSGRGAVGEEDAASLEPLLREFLEWKPMLPFATGDRIDPARFADLLAPLCRMLRDDVAEALDRQASNLRRVASDWRRLLFPEAGNDQFADAYAQTVTFALLLGRSLGAEPLSMHTAREALAQGHSLLSRALQVLTDSRVREELDASLNMLLRVIGVVPPVSLSESTDSWLYFFEDFLAAYDPKLRKQVGVYYTPIQVVRAQVRLADELLTRRLGRRLGFASPTVTTLDPAAGTGTYLLSIIDHAMERIEAEEGRGALPEQARELAERVYGFELLVGPYAVAELRTSQTLRKWGAERHREDSRVFLVDTLDSPNTEPRKTLFMVEEIANQRRRANKVKNEVRVLVCIGNPPYSRHGAVSAGNEQRLAAWGGWVRFGEQSPETGRRRPLGAKTRLDRRQDTALLADFIRPVKDAGHGGDLKNLYNFYIYFWRWALWKVFEQENGDGPGIVSFISASSYLYGDAFVGVREHMRRVCDELWILDLGGEGRGARQDPNVFAIQTPVAIAVAFRKGAPNRERPARVRYARIGGSKTEKLAALDGIDRFSDVEWQECPDDWQEPFFPSGKGRYFTWPLLTSLLPWQKSGVKAGRTWVIAQYDEVLEQRLDSLVGTDSKRRARLFKDSPTGRKAADSIKDPSGDGRRLTPVSRVDSGTALARTEQYSYRSFDRQRILSDPRLLDRPSPALQRAHGPRQIYVTTLLSSPLGHGPAATACGDLPDLDHFRGSYGAKNVFPLYRSSDASQPNIAPGLLTLFAGEYDCVVFPEDFVAYVYGVLAQPGYVRRWFEELATCEVRVPVTKDGRLFRRLRDVGAHLLWLHTWGERLQPSETDEARIEGSARCVKAVPGSPEGYPETSRYVDATRTLHVGHGEFAPVAPDVHAYEVSGLRVVQSWLDYRMKSGAGRRSSELDDIRPERWTAAFTSELLQLLHVLEATVAMQPLQEELLEAIEAGECFEARELPPVPDEMRKDPKATASPQSDLYEID